MEPADATSRNPSQTLGTNDPPEDPDDPPDVVTDEGGTILPKDIRIRILTPEEDQVFTADGDGLVSLDLHGKITYRKRPGDPNLWSLPGPYYTWLIDQNPTAVLTGPQGTVQVPLAPGKHDVILRIAETTHEESVSIDVVAGVAPAPPPPPQSDTQPASLLQQIINFLRRLFGG